MARKQPQYFRGKTVAALSWCLMAILLFDLFLRVFDGEANACSYFGLMSVLALLVR